MHSRWTRRELIGGATTVGLTVASARKASAEGMPAILGGKPTHRGQKFSPWPIIGDTDVSGLVDVLKSGLWNRLNGPITPQFEKTWADRLGAKHAIATANGTSALFTALNALNVGPGDEVIVPPYTFAATVNAVLLTHALPVFVDTDRETLQIDARKIEASLSADTACLMPAHIGGSVADMDTILKLAKAKSLPVIEDACQSPLAEWRHKKVATLGDMGCFSFQASKNLNSGEGGAILTDNGTLIEECRSFHNNGRSAPGQPGLFSRNGCNLRITEFQAAILLSQLSRLEDQSRTREQNAQYLTKQLGEIPGIKPASMYEGCTRNAYHLYMFRYDPTAFANLPRAGFLKALSAEGIPGSGGYTPLTDEPFLKHTLQSKGYRRIYGEKRLADHLDRIKCPVNDRVCGETVWFTQTMLLGPHSDMDAIAEAIRKIQTHAGAIAKL